MANVKPNIQNITILNLKPCLITKYMTTYVIEIIITRSINVIARGINLEE